MTVSRVINGEASVRIATRDAVDKAILALDYVLNPSARGLAGAGQTRIGLPYSNPSAGFLGEFLLAIRIDDRQAALTMTRHVLALGHRRIGFITGNPDLSASARRLEGFRAGLAEAGMSLDDLIAQGLYTYRSGLDAAEQLLALADPPTAICSSNDDMAAANGTDRSISRRSADNRMRHRVATLVPMGCLTA
jgi:DNA-binding LacI/PurR family transcriptional regulator